MRRILIIIAVFFITRTDPAQALRLCKDVEPIDVVKIGVLYRQVANGGSSIFEGNQLWNVMQTVPTTGRDVCVIGYPYPTEANGYKQLSSIRDKGQVHLVIGPTDTGIYADALRDAESFSTRRMVVISPVVTSTIREEPAGWIFKTNLSVNGRAHAEMDLLRQLSVDSIGIVYEDSKFGLDAEAAMRQAAADIKDYRAARYKLQSNLSSAVATMMQHRPTAIGILSSRKDFTTVMNTIEDKKKHLINPYNPIIFSLIDIRSLKIPDVNFVSVGDEKVHEVEQLSTTALRNVLAVIDEPSIKVMEPGTPEFAESLRDGIAGILDSSPLGDNGTRPSIFKLDEEKKQLINLGKTIRDYKFLEHIFVLGENLVRRFGYMPYVNIVTIIFFVVFMSWGDLRKWNDERKLSWRAKRKMGQVVAFNSFVALVVYFFMLSVGLIEWASWTAAIVVGCGYPTLLKSTLMQTKLGESIGMADRYDEHLRQLNDKVMEAQYRSQKGIIDYIAMTNSPARMQDTLEKIYNHASPKRKAELKTELDDALKVAKDSVGIRTELAKRIDRRHLRSELVDLGFLPRSDLKKLVGPNEILQAGLEYCSVKTSPLEQLENEFKRRIEILSKSHSKRAESGEDEVKEWVDRAQTDRGDMRAYLRWLFMQENFRIGKLISLDFLPKEARRWNKEQWKEYAINAELEMREEEQVNDKIMEAQYHNPKEVIDYIAMTNSPTKTRGGSGKHLQPDLAETEDEA